MTPTEPHTTEPHAHSLSGGTPAGRIGAWRVLRLGWRDFLLLAGALGLLWGLVGTSVGMVAGYTPERIVRLDLDLGNLPGYAGRTMLRMWIAYGCSLLFAIPVGFLAAHYARIRSLVLATIDVLQSIPVLGFLSITAAWFIALSGRNILGVESAAIFAIFTAQVWNLVFSVFHSVARIPTELREAAASCRLSTWQRITNLDLPASIHSLLWNSLMSFGSGWFFVCQSEAISTRQGEFMLPGLGSYLVAATDQGNTRAAMWCLLAMGLTIVLSDQLVWRPLLVWAEKFKLEQSGGALISSSWFYGILSASPVLALMRSRILAPLGETLRTIRPWLTIAPSPTRVEKPMPRLILRICRDASLWGACGCAAFFAIRGGISSLVLIHEKISLSEFAGIVGLGVLTLARVLAATLAASIIWVPLGILIGQRPRLSAVIQPIAQLAASFPVNMTFPFIVVFFAAERIPINWGSILLMGLGTQWYVLFNVVGAVSSIPSDLLDASRAFGVKGWELWRILFLPAIFPAWVTGACTTAGGAWNASVVGEIASWGNITLKAEGLGALVSDASRTADTPTMLCSIAVMSALVLMMNRLVWRPLFEIAERKFRLE